MTIFDSIKYPIADAFDKAGFLPGAKEIREAFPELYEEWLIKSWRVKIQPLNPYSDETAIHVKKSVEVLRRMLLEHNT